MGRKKPTNKELVQAIFEIDAKVEYICNRIQRVLSDFIEFSGESDKFKDFLTKKYKKDEDTKKEQDTKESK